MSEKNKKKKWMRFRHRIVRNLAYVVLYPYSRIRYGITIEKFKEQENRPYLILYNHQTAFDQFFVGMAFKGPVYYLATEDIFSLGWISSVIKFIVAPIPIKKQTTDVKAILNCIRVSKEGGTIAIAPEGNRTYSGKTEYINPAIVPLVRKLGLPIALFRLEGGYGVHPRWSDVVRRGKMRGFVSRVISPDEYKDLTDSELAEIINSELFVNEAVADAEFHHKRLAEYLERAIYVCPDCGLSRFESFGDVIECKKCGKQVRYLPTKQLSGIGFDFPFEFVTDWYDYQKDFINRLPLEDMNDDPLYEDTAEMREVIVYEKKVLLHRLANITLCKDRIVVSADGTEYSFTFDDTSAVTVLGKNKLNIYHNKRVYQLKGDVRFNALKYVNIFNRYKNIKNGDKDGEFLGL